MELAKETTNFFLKNILNELAKNGVEFSKNGILLTKQEILNAFTKPKCIGVNVKDTVTKCNKKVVFGSNYCEKHVNKNNECASGGASCPVDYKVRVEPLEAPYKIIQNLPTKFINNEFYYIDSKYIYSKSDYSKVGIQSNGFFILTDDPFVLEDL